MLPGDEKLVLDAAEIFQQPCFINVCWRVWLMRLPARMQKTREVARCFDRGKLMIKTTGQESGYRTVVIFGFKNIGNQKIPRLKQPGDFRFILCFLKQVESGLLTVST